MYSWGSRIHVVIVLSCRGDLVLPRLTVREPSPWTTAIPEHLSLHERESRVVEVQESDGLAFPPVVERLASKRPIPIADARHDLNNEAPRTSRVLGDVAKLGLSLWATSLDN